MPTIAVPFARNQPKASRSQDLGVASTFTFNIPASCRYSFDAVEVHSQNNRWVGWPQDSCYASKNVVYAFFMKSEVDGAGHNNAAEHQFFRIYFSKSTDGGATWSAATRIVEDTSRSQVYQGSMMGAPDRDGRLYIARRVIAYAGSITDHNNSNIGLKTNSNPNGEKFEIFISDNQGDTWTQLQWDGENQWPSTEFLDYRHGGIFWEPEGGDKRLIVGFYSYTNDDPGPYLRGRSGLRIFNLTQNTWSSKFIFQPGFGPNEQSLAWDAQRNIFFGFTRANELRRNRFWLSFDDLTTFRTDYCDNGATFNYAPIPVAISPDNSTYFALYSERYNNANNHLGCRMYLLEGKAEEVIRSGFSAFKIHSIGNCTQGAQGSTGTPSAAVLSDRIVWLTASKGVGAFGGIYALRQFFDQPGVAGSTLTATVTGSIDSGNPNGNWQINASWAAATDATGYRVEYRPAIYNSTWISVNKTSAEFSHSWPGLLTGKYFVRLTVLYAGGIESLPSASILWVIPDALKTLVDELEAAAAADPNGSGLANWAIYTGETFWDASASSPNQWNNLGEHIPIPMTLGGGTSPTKNLAWQNGKAGVVFPNNSTTYFDSTDEDFGSRAYTEFSVVERGANENFLISAHHFQTGAAGNSSLISFFAILAAGTIHFAQRSLTGSYLGLTADSAAIAIAEKALVWGQRDNENSSVAGEMPAIAEKTLSGVTSRPKTHVRTRIGNLTTTPANNNGTMGLYALCNIALGTAARQRALDAIKAYFGL